MGWEINGTNSTLCIQSKQQRIRNIEIIISVDYLKGSLFFPIDYWIITAVVSSAKSSGNQGNISSSTSFEQSPEIRRRADVSICCFRGTDWNAALTEPLKKI
jgi:hypothetical protein